MPQIGQNPFAGPGLPSPQDLLNLELHRKRMQVENPPVFAKMPQPMAENPPVFAKIYLCPICEGGKHPAQFGSINGAQSHLWTFHRIPKRVQKRLEDAGIKIIEKNAS